MEVIQGTRTLRALVPRQSIASSRNDPASASSLVSTLVPALIYAVLFVALFLLLRTRYPRQYSPRTYFGTLRQSEQTPALPTSLLGWIKSMNKLPDTYVLQHNSLDAFFLLRYLKISIIISFVGCLVTWPILFPVDATGTGRRQQLDILTMGNIDSATDDGYRFYAHVFVSWIYIGFVFFMVTREMIFYINLRQAYLLSPLYAERISSRTVLFQSVPTAYADEQKIRTMFGEQLKNVWIAQDTKKLEDMVDQRTKAAMKLENAETKLIKLCNKARLKQQKTNGESSELDPIDDGEFDNESGSVAARYITAKQRPTHRLTFLIGKKVDTINWAREEIMRLNPLIQVEQDAYRATESKAQHGVFVEFWRQTDAQAAYQMVMHHQALQMTPRVVGLSPGEVIWSNLGISWRTRTGREIAAIAVVVATIIFWSFPVAVVGAISNVNWLAEKVYFLKWILDLPGVILGVITGLLPSVALSLLMAVLPPFIRFLAIFAGSATSSIVELWCQEAYFWFEVIQVFLVTTMTSAASAAIPQVLENPSSIASLLASSLPSASNFYISYFIVQGLGFASAELLSISGLIVFELLSRVFDTTPRKMFKRWSSLSSLGWGTVFPVLELLTVISIAYSAIAPLMLGFSTIGLFLFYFAYRYNLLYVNSSDVDTKGLVYAKALKHTLVGPYLSVICLIGLFAVSAGGKGKGPLILMVIFLVFMVLFHISLLSAINPLLNFLPRSLEAEEASLLASDDGFSNVIPAFDTGVRKESAFKGNEKTGAFRNAATSTLKPQKAAGMLRKFFRPDIYASYQVMRQLVPQDFAQIVYAPEVERDAYQHPAVTNVAPLLWVPRDEMGVSRQECAHTNKATPMTDEGAHFNEKGKIVWDEEGLGGRPPIYEENILY